MLDEKVNASMERNDETMKPYSKYVLSKYFAFEPDLVILKKQVEEYFATEGGGRFDSIERIMIDQFSKGFIRGSTDGTQPTVDISIVKPAVHACNDVADWLVNDCGLTLNKELKNEHEYQVEGGGQAIVDALVSTAEKAGASIIYDTQVIKLIAEDNRVTGVVAVGKDGKESTYNANCGVVLATGSYVSDAEACAVTQRMGSGLTTDNPTVKKTPVTGGIALAQELGAKVRDMQFVDLLLLGFENGCTPQEAKLIEGTQMLAVNSKGESIGTNGTLKAIGAAAASQEGGLAFLVGDKTMYDAMEANKAGIVDEFAARDWVFKADTLFDAARAAGLSAVALYDTIEAGDIQFGQGPYVVAKMQLHYNMILGGLVIDSNAHVLDTDRRLIYGLYAAGDVISGINGATLQSANGLTAAIYYGRLAGKNALAEADIVAPAKTDKVEKALEPSSVIPLDEAEKKLVGEMIQIPAGSFMMGTPAYENYRDESDEHPVHEVTLKSFGVAKYPVTIGQYRAFCEATNRPMPEDPAQTSFDSSPAWVDGGTWEEPFPGTDGYKMTDDYPVTCITWFDAKDYCAWLFEQTRRDYRLLTDAEYEYACRAGTTTPYYTGGTVIYTQANFGRCYGSRTTPVGCFAPNQWGLYDMMGNMWQWVEDDYVRTSYEGAPCDGSAWVIEDAEKKGTRGGSWNVDGLYLRSGSRDGYVPETRMSRIGFRIALTLG